MALPHSGKTATVSSSFGAAHGQALDWTTAHARLALPCGAVNIAHAAVDRHVAEGRGEHIAIRWLGRHNERAEISFARLAEMAARTAAVLKAQGIGPGDVVATLLPRSPDLYAVALGAWKVGAVFSPLFSAFGPGPLRARMELGRAKLLVATDSIYARKVAAGRPAVASLQTVLLVGEEGGPAQLLPGCQDLRALQAAADPASVQTHATRAEDPAFLHFTSGTTGTPKGAVNPHGAAIAHLVTGRQVFDLRHDDVYWCTADPGWITNTAYGIIAPLVNGCTSIVDEAGFDPRRWYGILSDEAVTVWYTTPTCIRMMMRFGAALARSYRQTSLRVAASVGEPLNPEAVAWGEKALGVPFLDTWWQTETGAVTIANLPGAIRHGSMGRPLPGIETRLVQRNCAGIEQVEGERPGELAIRAAMPSLFTTYINEPDRYESCFEDGWYLTGDLVREDKDGFYWFVGRCDDIIKSAAQQIGPFEVESTLMDHPAVAEIGVVGKPDMLVSEVPVAFVSLNPGFEPGESLRLELLSFARHTLGSAMAPREIHFVETMPKTTTGKILRRALKAKALGEPEMEGLVMLDPRVGRFDDE